MANIDFTAVALAVSTVVLAVITFFYMRETRLMRRAGEVPSFSLEPRTYILGGDFLTLDLLNNGQMATEILIECSWQESTMKFYIVSLSTGGRARLEGIPIMEITKNSKKITLSLSCKDAKGRPFSPPLLEIDFEKIKSENRHIAYQYSFSSVVVDKLDEIKKELKRISDNFRK